MPAAVWIPLAVLLVGVLCVAYAWLYERKAFRLRRVTVPVLPPGSPDLAVLHISDMHFTAGQPWKERWVRQLAALEPDLVVDTGDNLGGSDGVPPTYTALEPLLARPGVFVPGSNDWFEPAPKNPARYLHSSDGHRRHYGPRLPWGEVRAHFIAAGWTDLTHRRTTINLRGVDVELAGVSDAHLLADHYDRVAGPVRGDVAIGLSHSPEPRVVDSFAADGFSLVMSGHTHGGQLRVPGYGALVTNCGLERKRARGLSKWPNGGYLHVSAGLGTSRYAPVRFACPPEATLLTLTARAE
jgi:predicted MPP superfamily phosphohydrolase